MIEVVPELMELDVQMAFLGTGDVQYEEQGAPVSRPLSGEESRYVMPSMRDWHIELKPGQICLSCRPAMNLADSASCIA